MKFTELPTPCYVVDEAKIIDNLKILKGVMDRTGAKILLAQKAFSFYEMYPLIGRYLAGATASGIFEARLGLEEMVKPLAEEGRKVENHVFSPAFRDEDFDEILRTSDHIVFNSPRQVEKFGERAKACGKSIGLRTNPQCSTQEGHEIYDPCAPGSRLGTTLEELEQNLQILPLLDGLHFHTLCEQNSDDLETTLNAFEEKFGKYLKGMKWVNFGGGHHITREDYDIETLERCIRRMQDTYGVEVYLEPGEAIALNAGYLITTVLETRKTGVKIEGPGTGSGSDELLVAIVDTSAACHMPDVLEMPYRPPLFTSGESGEKAYTYRLGGPTCLAGDIIGDFSFDHELKEGERLVFGDMAIYSMVKNNTFNGMPLPAIALQETNGDCRIVRSFSYEDFKCRL